jgi:putative tryptophan/tyrosine transport system substrate-binding protein
LVDYQKTNSIVRPDLRFLKNISKILPGVVSILILSTILLISDLSNRNGGTTGNNKIRIAMVHYGFTRDCNDVQDGILMRFTEKGYLRDKDFIFEEFNSNSDIGTLNEIVKVISGRKYNLIFTTTLAVTQAISKKISNSPVLFTVVADPVGNGLGKSYTDHIQNITGIDAMSYTDKGVALLKKYLPGIRRVGLIYVPGEMASVSGLKELDRSCRENGIDLVSVPVNTVSEVVEATSVLSMKNIGAVCQMPDNCSIPAFSGIIQVTRKYKIPLFCFISSQVKQGAVAAIAGDFIQQGREIADIGFEVLKGKSPAEIPFSRLRQIKTVINLQAASAYGIETPDEIITAADEIFGKE